MGAGLKFQSEISIQIYIGDFNTKCRQQLVTLVLLSVTTKPHGYFQRMVDVAGNGHNRWWRAAAIAARCPRARAWAAPADAAAAAAAPPPCAVSSAPCTRVADLYVPGTFSCDTPRGQTRNACSMSSMPSILYRSTCFLVVMECRRTRLSSSRSVHTSACSRCTRSWLGPSSLNP
jgi:hypothetical protein